MTTNKKTKLVPKKPKYKSLVLRLNYKPHTIKIVNVRNILTGKDEDISLIVVNKALNIPLNWMRVTKNGITHLEYQSMQGFKEFFCHFDIPENETEQKINEAVKVYGNMRLHVCLNRYIFHDDKEFMRFCKQKDTIIISNNDNIYDLHKHELNLFYKFKKLVIERKYNSNLLYQILEFKEIFLRKLQNTQGKGTAYYNAMEEDDYD